MSNPISPNFKPGVGRLVTDRFDFQNHVDGYSFRQNAKSIDLVPTININGIQTNVHDAIEELKNALSVPIVPNATTISRGIVQLSGDIAGTATSVSVTGLRGFPIASTPPALNQVLTWTGSNWQPQAISGAFSFAGDVTGTALATVVSRINGKPVVSTTPNTNDGLIWTGATWEPIRVIPTGTGFNTVTSGSIDAAATANIRYASGKFQTDVNIQFNNSSITGDLAWAPTSSNKTLTLPNATDTLVGLATTDVLTNKTINATNNTITDTSTATGDILVSNGTKFVRLAQGGNGSFLGVSGGSLGYFAAAGGVSVFGTGFVHATSNALDSNATQNIRYESGKFQTDVNIQFKNSSITGDLAWAPTSSNKTLTLPNATDTLVGRDTTDVLTNKTINVSNNFLSANSQAIGDLLKNDGSSFVRIARGSASQILRVNSGGTDLEWATIAVGGSSDGTSGDIQTSNGSGGFLAATNVKGGSGFISVGANPSTISQIRLTAAISTDLINYRFGGVNYNAIRIASDNKIVFGDVSYPNGLQIQSNLITLHSTSFPITLFGEGNLSLTATASDVKFALPIGGDTGANRPFCWKRITLAGAASQTLTSASYENVILEVASTGDNQVVILPLTIGAFFIAKNTGSGTGLLFRASTGSGIAVSGGLSKMIYCDGTNYVLATT